MEGGRGDDGGRVEGQTVTGRLWTWLDNLCVVKKLLPVVTEERQVLVFQPNQGPLDIRLCQDSRILEQAGC